MITAVVLKLSPELHDALRTHNPVDKALVDAYESTLSINGSDPELHIEPDMAEDWCTHWWGEEALQELIATGLEREPFNLENWDDPLLQDFMSTVRKIYRLTVSV